MAQSSGPSPEFDVKRKNPNLPLPESFPQFFFFTTFAGSSAAQEKKKSENYFWHSEGQLEDVELVPAPPEVLAGLPRFLQDF